MAKKNKKPDSKRTFKCVPCKKSYTTRQALCVHRHTFKTCPDYKPPKNGERKIVRRKKKFPCEGCSKNFASNQGLQRHQEKSKSNPKICQLKPPPKDYYVKDVGVHHKRTFDCDPCGKKYKNPHGLKYHRQHSKSCSLYQPPEAGNGKNTEDSNLEAENTGSKRKHRCDKCNKNYARKETLREHQSRPPCPYYKPELDDNGQVIPYQPKHMCETCQTRFASKDAMCKHRNRNICQAILERRRLFTKYTTPEERAQKKRIPCNVTFPSEKILLRHKVRNVCKRNVRFEEWKCHKCGKTFTRKDSLRYHLKNNSCKKGKQTKRKKKHQIYKCDQCDTYFTSKGALDRHKRGPCPSNQVNAEGIIIPRAKDYLCEDCRQSYTTRNNLLRHKNDGTCQRRQEKLEKERMWRDQVNGPQILETLTSTRTPKPLVWYKCENCDQYFIQKYYIRHHQRTACKRYLALKSAGDFVCSFCNAVFKTEDKLQHHIVLKCSKALRHEDDITRRPLTCEFCDLRFSKKETLAYHHYHKICESNDGAVELEKPYQCRKCHQRFSAKLSLNSHYRRLHCQQFNLTETLEKIANVEPEKLKLKFNCRWCSEHFGSQDEMVTHMEVDHKKEIPKDKLMTVDDKTPVDPLRPITHTCYICLKRFPQLIGVALNIESCEKKIGVSGEGFVQTIERLR